RLRQIQPLSISRLIEARRRWHDKVRPPALLLVKTFYVVVNEFDPRHPLDALFTEQAGYDDARRKTVTRRERLSIHLVNHQRGRGHRFGERKGVGVTLPCAPPRLDHPR